MQAVFREEKQIDFVSSFPYTLSDKENVANMTFKSINVKFPRKEKMKCSYLILPIIWLCQMKF